MRQRPRRSGSRGDGDADREADPLEAPVDIAYQPVFPAEQMRDAGYVEPQSIAVDLDQRRPAAGPFGEALDERGIAFGIGGNCDQAWIERAGVGQPRSGPRATLCSGLGHRINDQPVRSLDGEDDRAVRR